MSEKRVPITDLPTFATAKSKNIMKDHEKHFADTVKSVKRSAAELSNVSHKFGSGVKNAWGSIDKTTSEQGLRLTELIDQTATDLAQKQTGLSYREVETFHETSIAASNRIILAVRRYIPKVHRILKSEIITLNTSLIKIEEAINTLGKVLDQSPGAKLIQLEREITIISQDHDLLNQLRSKHAETKIKAENVLNEQESLVEQKKKLLQQTELRELESVEAELNARAANAEQHVQQLVKPLLKFQRAIKDQESYPTDKAFIEKLIDYPVTTLLETQPNLTFELLRRLNAEMNRGNLEMDERKFRKAKESMDTLTGTLESFREDYDVLKESISKKRQGLRSIGLLPEIERVDDLLQAKKLELEQLAAAEAEYDRKIRQLTETILKRKATIELQVSKLLKEQITIDIS